MKKSVLIIAAVALLAALSCTKQEQTQSTADGRIIVTATIENAATKVAFTEGVGEIKGVWEADDHIIGWDADGRAIELAVEKIRDNGAAQFATVSGSAPLPASGKVYMIYAPGKGISDVGNKSLAYDLTSQNGDNVPALMTATGVVAGNRLELRFKNELALVAVKNPSFPVTAETTMRGLKISGDNINTVATFSMNGEDLVMASSNPGALTRNCEFTTTATGASEVMTYFAVLPDSTPADITVSTVEPEGYQNIYTGRSFVKGQCYIMDTQTIDKRKFSITIADGIENGSVTTDPENECGWGETVTVNAEPDEDYVVDQITVTANNADIPVTDNTFTMPSEGVLVTVTFKIPVSSVSLNKASTSLTVGESETLTATVTPANATNPAITWSSSDETVATVTENGVVKGISVGNATITAECVDDTTKFDSCNVKIIPNTGQINGHYYVLIGGKKWATQNVSISSSGQMKWKGETSSAVKTPITNEDVVVGDYFQWAASYEGYGITDNPQPDDLLIYESFTNRCCVDGGTTTKSEFIFKDGKGLNINCAPYSNGSSYSKYTNQGNQLEKSDDTANILWGDSWRMPTDADFNSLYAATHWAYDKTEAGFYVFLPDANHHAGSISSITTSGLNKADALLFFPEVGCGKSNNATIEDVSARARYWYNSVKNQYGIAYDLLIYSISQLQFSNTAYRHECSSIRPVSD